MALTKEELREMTLLALATPRPAAEPPIGWTADPEWMLYETEVLLGINGGRTYRKGYDGWAVCGWSSGCFNGWHGPLVVSTDREWAGILDPVAGRVIADQGPFYFDGLDWYLSVGSQLGSQSGMSTPLNIITRDDFVTNKIGDLVQYLLQRANAHAVKGGFAPRP